jgi:hypothetical protein
VNSARYRQRVAGEVQLDERVTSLGVDLIQIQCYVIGVGEMGSFASGQ